MTRRAAPKKRCSSFSWESQTATSTLGALPVPGEAPDGAAMAASRASAELQAQLTAQAHGGGQGGVTLPDW